MTREETIEQQRPGIKGRGLKGEMSDDKRRSY